METINQYKWALVAAGVAVLGIVGLVANASQKTEQEKQAASSEQKAKENEAKKAEETKKETAAASTSTSYDYTAKPGDSYTVLVRKAIQKYNTDQKSALSQAQVIAAETQLAIKAGLPELEIGQKFSLKQADLKAAVDAAKKLSAGDLAAWETYVPYVDFDTSKNG